MRALRGGCIANSEDGSHTVGAHETGVAVMEADVSTSNPEIDSVDCRLGSDAAMPVLNVS